MSNREQTMAVVRALVPEIRNHIKKISPPTFDFFGDEDLDRILEATVSEALDVIANRDSVLVGEFVQAIKGSFSFLQESPEEEKQEQPNDEEEGDMTDTEADERSADESGIAEQPQEDKKHKEEKRVSVPVVSLQVSGANEKKGVTYVVVRLKSESPDSNLFVGVRISGGLNKLVGLRINAEENTSHSIPVPHGHKVTLRIL